MLGKNKVPNQLNIWTVLETMMIVLSLENSKLTLQTARLNRMESVACTYLSGITICFTLLIGCSLCVLHRFNSTYFRSPQMTCRTMIYFNKFLNLI